MQAIQAQGMYALLYTGCLGHFSRDCIATSSCDSVASASTSYPSNNNESQQLTSTVFRRKPMPAVHGQRQAMLLL